MADFQIGDRVNRDRLRYPDATVTELTERGFKWRLDEPYTVGPRYGWFQEGEAYTDIDFHGWHVVSKVPVSQPSQTDGFN